MLIYMDNPTCLRVFRANDDPAGPKRIVVGRIMKNNYEFIGDDRVAPASEEEAGDIQRVIQAFKDTHQGKLRSEAMSFPEIARRVAEFYVASADDVEKRLISTAVAQIARALRKVDRSASTDQPIDTAS